MTVLSSVSTSKIVGAVLSAFGTSWYTSFKNSTLPIWARLLLVGSVALTLIVIFLTATCFSKLITTLSDTGFSADLASLALLFIFCLITLPSSVSTNIVPSVIPLTSTTTSSAFILGTSIDNFPTTFSPSSSTSGLLLGSIVIPLSESSKRSFTSPWTTPTFSSSRITTSDGSIIAEVSYILSFFSSLFLFIDSWTMAKSAISTTPSLFRSYNRLLVPIFSKIDS